jgi:hypothetical protein
MLKPIRALVVESVTITKVRREDALVSVADILAVVPTKVGDRLALELRMRSGPPLLVDGKLEDFDNGASPALEGKTP